jgi:hypothetical protein
MMNGVNNILEHWKIECYLISSPLSLHKKFERHHIDFIYKTLSDYFGIDYFNVDSENRNPNNSLNWIVWLLGNWKKRASIIALFEIANTLKYLEGLPKSTQKKFKSVIPDMRQFRDLFFELYIFRLLDYNKIPNEKKPKEGEKELDVVCTINNTEFLGECKKLYAPGVDFMDLLQYVMISIVINLKKLNRGQGLIGLIKFGQNNDQAMKTVFENKLSKFAQWFNETRFQKLDYKDICADGELIIYEHSEANIVETESIRSSFDITFKIIPPSTPVYGIPNTYHSDIQANFELAQNKINRKLFDTFTVKSEQHLNSKYQNKIYFIDSEAGADFNFPIFKFDGMFEADKIQCEIENYSENEVFCFIRRDYTNDIPKVTIKVLGKNIDKDIKKSLEGLKTNIDFVVR